MNVPVISPQQLSERARSAAPLHLIDVRTPVEFQEVHVDFARNIPLDQLDAKQSPFAALPPDEAVYVICRSGGRGRQACEKLLAAGLNNVVNVEGGTQAWVAAGLPVIRGRKCISLERQVRIAAGLLVVTGAVLALTVSPYWIALSGFVGAGLVFAGVTDTCGMGLLLARMPWNQVAAPKPSTGTGAACATQSSGSCCG